jgi:hypothetical protein
MDVGLEESIIETLATVRAVTVPDLRAEIEAVGSGGLMVTSHEVVTVLVMLQPQTGVDPTNPDVLKGCDLQSLAQLVTFVSNAAEARK